MHSTGTGGNIISFILVAQPLLMQPQWSQCGEEVIYSSYCAKCVQSDSLVQYLPLPLTRKSWANSVNFCCLIYKTRIKTAHPSPFLTIMPCLALCISAWGLLRPLVHCLPWTGGVNVKPSLHSPSLILQRFFSGGMRVSPPHLRGPDALVGGLCPGALEGHSKNPQAPQMTPISCQGSVSSSTTRC